MQIWTGTLAVENGETHVVATGDPLAGLYRGAQVIIDGVTYLVDAADETNPLTEFDLTRVYAGVTDSAAPADIVMLDETTLTLQQIAPVVARLTSQLDIYDKNSSGVLFGRAVAGTNDPGAGKFSFSSDSFAVDSTLGIRLSDTDGNGHDVAGILGLWSSGTILTIRALNSGGYVSLSLAGDIAQDSGFHVATGTVIGTDGGLGIGEPYAIWFAKVGSGLAINASGDFAGRDDYDGEDGGFVYASSDGDGEPGSPPMLFVKASAASGDWGPGIPFRGATGDRGWTPALAFQTVSGRYVLRLNGYVGGEGSAPTDNVGKYYAAGGAFVSNAGDALDFKGLTGATGAAGTNGTNGADGADGAPGVDGTDGLDGTDPGVLLIWDEGTSDSDLGAGKVWADDSLDDATTLFVSKTNRASDDIEDWLLGLDASDSTIKGQLTLTRSGGNAQAIVDIAAAGVDDRTGYVAINISGHAGAAGFTTNDAISIQFSRTGNKGLDGGGAGDVVGPDGGVVANEYPLFDGTTGKLIKGSGQLYGSFAEKASNLGDLSNKQSGFDALSLKGANIASASTVNLDTATGSLVTITGTAETTAFTLTSGRRRRLVAAAAWPIKAGANLVIKGVSSGSTYTCAAGDELDVWADGTTIRATVHKASGKAAAAPAFSEVSSKPTTLSGYGITDAATSTQGGKADTAVQPARTITAGTGLTGGGDLSADRTLAVDLADAAGFRAAVASKPIAPDVALSAMDWVALTDAGTIAVDHAGGVNRKVTLGGNRAFGAPSNAKVGWPLNVWVVQDGTGGRVPTWASDYDFGDYGTPVLSSGANQADLVTFVCLASDKFAFLGLRKRVD